MGKKRINLSLDENFYDKIKEVADLREQSMQGQLRYLVLLGYNALREQERDSWYWDEMERRQEDDAG